MAAQINFSLLNKLFLVLLSLRSSISHIRNINFNLVKITWLNLKTWSKQTQNKPIQVAVLISLIIHLVIISLEFAYPDPSKNFVAPALNIILVNSQSTRPDDPQARAQFDLDGGGNSADEHIQKSLLDVSLSDRLGEELQQTARKQQQLQVRFRPILHSKQSEVNKAITKQSDTPTIEQFFVGRDDVTTERVISKLEAEIARETKALNKMPKKQFVSPRTLSYAAAAYLEKWSDKVEQIGNLTYPEEAKGKLYGSLAIYIEIRPNGNIYQLKVERSSGNAILDQAAIRFIRQSAPFDNISDSVLEGKDVLSFARVIHFAKAGELTVNEMPEEHINNRIIEQLSKEQLSTED